MRAGKIEIGPDERRATHRAENAAMLRETVSLVDQRRWRLSKQVCEHRGTDIYFLQPGLTHPAENEVGFANPKFVTRRMRISLS